MVKIKEREKGRVETMTRLVAFVCIEPKAVKRGQSLSDIKF